MSERALAAFVDRYTMRHVRDLPHPVQRVWAVLTTAEEIERWMDFPVTVDLRVGATWIWGPPDGPYFTTEVAVLEPPRVLELRNPLGQAPVGGFIRFELKPTATGTRFVFTQHVPPGRYHPVEGDLGGDLPGGTDTMWHPGFVGGWHLAFDSMAAVLDGHDPQPQPADPRFGALIDEWLKRKVREGKLTEADATRFGRELRAVAEWDDLNRIYREHIRVTIPTLEDSHA